MISFRWAYSFEDLSPETWAGPIHIDGQPGADLKCSRGHVSQTVALSLIEGNVYALGFHCPVRGCGFFGDVWLRGYAINLLA